MILTGMATKGTDYIPAMHYEELNPLFDPGMRYLMREHIFKEDIVRNLDLREEQLVLDVGCGSGTLALMIKTSAASTNVVGVDIDKSIIEIAQEKTRRVGKDLSLQIGSATDLPYRDAAFDRVATSLAFHHLNREQKERALDEIKRVLAPGGKLILADFGPPSNFVMRTLTFVTGLMEDIEDNVKERIPEMLKRAGFFNVRRVGRHDTLMGTIVLLKAEKEAA